MIQVRCLPDSASHVSELGLRWGIMLGSSPQQELVFGDVFIGHEDPEPSDPISMSVQFGWITSTGKVMGKLRDKEVSHLNAKGEINVTGSLIGSLPASPDFLRPGQVSKDRVGYVGGAPKLVHLLTMWGQAAASDTYWDVGHIEQAGGWVADPHTLHAHTSVSFEGDFGVVISAIDSWDRVLRKPHAWPEHQFVNALYNVTFLRRERAQGGDVVYKSATFVSQFADDGYAIILDGIPVKRNSWTANLQGFGSYCSVETTSFPGLGLGGSLAIYENLLSILKSDNFVTYVWQALMPDTRHIDTPWGKEYETFEAWATAHGVGWGTLTNDILAQQRHCKANVLLALFDLLLISPNTVSEVKNFSSLCEAVKKWAQNSGKGLKEYARTVRRIMREVVVHGSSTFLGVTYGVLPMESDMEKVCAGIREQVKPAVIPDRRHSRREAAIPGLLHATLFITRVMTAEIASVSTDVMELVMDYMRFWKSWGIWPTISGAYDFIPFSFVLDRSLDVGSAAKAADQVIDTQYFPLGYLIMSEERRWSPELTPLFDLEGLSGSVEFSFYERFLDTTFPTSPIVAEAAPPTNIDGHEVQWSLEAGAILVRGGRGLR